MSVGAYASYRDSGVEWLGEVPSHWQVRRLKHIADAFPSNVDKKSYDDGKPVRLCNYTDVYYNDVITDDPDYMLATATADQVAKFTLRAGDTIITKDSETADDIASAAYVPVDMPGVVCGYHLSMIRPRAEVSGAFIKRYFDSAFAKASVHVRANGLTRVGLGQYAVDNLDLPVPPLSEQAAIAAFLDRETGKIDALVEAQRLLIELLKEKRQAVISHAVTKGLDPTVQMKDSGVEWLGKIPEHWKMGRLSREGHFFQGKAHEPYVDDDGEHICVTARFVSTSGQRVKLCSRNLSPAKLGDILMVMSDLPNGRALARAYLVADNRSYAVNQRVCAISIKRGDPRFFAYQLNRNMQLLQFNDGVEQTHLKNGAFTRLLLAVPPPDEQRRLADQIDRRLAEWDQLTTEAERAVVLLQERRAALISAAVTGKIDVGGQSDRETEAA